MVKLNIAIVGLGRIGSAFLDAIQKKQNVNLVCVAERADTPSKTQAASAGIMIATLDEVVGMSEIIDIIFDLTGIHEVRNELRDKLRTTNNTHTVIAPETIVYLIWSLISDEELPVIEGRMTGY